MKAVQISPIMASALLSLASPANAEPAYFLNRTIVSRIPAKDIPSLKTAVGRILNNAPDGARSDWQGSSSRRNPPVGIAFQVLQSTQSQKLGACRLLSAQLSQAPSTESWHFWFCKQADGGWKASGSLD